MAKTAMKRNAISGMLFGSFQRRHLTYILRTYFVLFVVLYCIVYASGIRYHVFSTDILILTHGSEYDWVQRLQYGERARKGGMRTNKRIKEIVDTFRRVHFCVLCMELVLSFFQWKMKNRTGKVANERLCIVIVTISKAIFSTTINWCTVNAFRRQVFLPALLLTYLVCLCLMNYYS